MCNAVASVGAIPFNGSSAEALVSLIVLATIQAQDLQDIQGDSICGRRTLPILFPRESRASVAVFVAVWTIFICIRCKTPLLGGLVLSLLGLQLGFRFMVITSERDDRRSYIYIT